MKLHRLLQKCSFFLIKLAVFLARGGAHMKLQMFGTVGRATVPAETGRHGGRPYDSARPKFLFRFDWKLAASGAARMKLHVAGTANRRLSNIEPQNVEVRFI
jgi:hypothetical protein